MSWDSILPAAERKDPIGKRESAYAWLDHTSPPKHAPRLCPCSRDEAVTHHVDGALQRSLVGRGEEVQ